MAEYLKEGSILKNLEELFEQLKPEAAFFFEVTRPYTNRVPIHWIRIRDAFGNFAIRESSRSIKFWLNFRKVLDTLDAYECKEKEVISFVLQVGYFFFIGQDKEAEAFIWDTYVPDLVLKMPHKNSVEKLMVQRYGYKYTPWRPLRSYEDISTEVLDDDILNTLIKRGDLDFLAVMIKYGVMYYPANNRHYWWKKISDLGCDVNWAVDQDRPISKRREFRDCIILNVLYFLLEIEMGDALHMKHLEGLRRIFDIIPEPIVTSSEIKLFLILYIAGGLEFSDGIRQMWEVYFPEARQPPRPRSLKHLSRCAVRQCLREAANLPYGVESLHLPECLNQYILLGEFIKSPGVPKKHYKGQENAQPEAQDIEQLETPEVEMPETPEAENIETSETDSSDTSETEMEASETDSSDTSETEMEASETENAEGSDVRNAELTVAGVFSEVVDTLNRFWTFSENELGINW